MPSPLPAVSIAERRCSMRGSCSLKSYRLTERFLHARRSGSRSPTVKSLLQSFYRLISCRLPWMRSILGSSWGFAEIVLLSYRRIDSRSGSSMSCSRVFSSLSLPSLRVSRSSRLRSLLPRAMTARAAITATAATTATAVSVCVIETGGVKIEDITIATAGSECSVIMGSETSASITPVDRRTDTGAGQQAAVIDLLPRRRLLTGIALSLHPGLLNLQDQAAVRIPYRVIDPRSLQRHREILKHQSSRRSRAIIAIHLPRAIAPVGAILQLPSRLPRLRQHARSVPTVHTTLLGAMSRFLHQWILWTSRSLFVNSRSSLPQRWVPRQETDSGLPWTSRGCRRPSRLNSHSYKSNHGLNALFQTKSRSLSHRRGRTLASRKASLISLQTGSRFRSCHGVMASTTLLKLSKILRDHQVYPHSRPLLLYLLLHHR